MDYIKYVISLQFGTDKNFVMMIIVKNISLRKFIVLIIIESKLFKQAKIDLMGNLIPVHGVLEMKN